MGVPLIERDTGGYAGLTPAGRRFVLFAPQLVHAAQAAKTAASGTPVETLRLAVPAGVGVVAPLMPQALAGLNWRYSTLTPTWASSRYGRHSRN